MFGGTANDNREKFQPGSFFSHIFGLQFNVKVFLLDVRFVVLVS
jgi:hypothetical protein